MNLKTLSTSLTPIGLAEDVYIASQLTEQFRTQ
jgi:hypothetical protein